MKCMMTLLLGILLSLPARAADVRPMVGTDARHVVEPGDDLYKVAHRYRLGLEHITWANKIPMQLELDEGQELVVPLRRVLPRDPPRDGMVLNLPERGIFLFRRGRFVAFYPIAIGDVKTPTPTGRFRVVEKIANPTWYPPRSVHIHEKFIPPGPDNPLGDRWIGLSTSRVGIHGTDSPYCIGMAVSHGCIRMYPDESRELFGQVDPGMSIRIEYEPVKLGRDAAGQYFLAVFPDVYNRVDPRGAALRAATGTPLPRQAVLDVVAQMRGDPRAVERWPASSAVEP